MTSVENLFFAALILILFLIVVFGILLPVFKRHKEVTCGIENYNSTMTRFVYKVDFSRDEIIRLLEIKNIGDEIFFQFDTDRSIVTVSEPGASQKYCCTIVEYEGYSIPKLEKVHFLDMQSYIQYKMNPCIIRKLSAEPVPFSEYGF